MKKLSTAPSRQSKRSSAKGRTVGPRAEPPANVVLIAHVDHHKCNGTGFGSRVHARCRGCNGTGEAGFAFKRELERRGLTGVVEDRHVEDVLNAYVEVCYGPGAHLYFEEDRRPCYVLTVLPHSVDRAALESVSRLGGFDKVFNWLVAAEREHCPLGAEAEWSP